MTNPKRILVTGGTGFAGSFLLEKLLDETGSLQLFASKRMSSNLENVHHIFDKLTWVDCDLTDPFSTNELIQKSEPSEIYHLAALSWVTPSWNMPVAYMNTNAIGTINLLEAVRRNNLNPRILVSCTPEEYGDVCPTDLPITEDTPLHPLNPYAASKVAQDMVCTTWSASYGQQIIRTRAFNHEGPRRNYYGANASFAYQIARIELGLQSPIIRVGNLAARRNFTDVRDIVRAYLLAMECCVPNELYLIGSANVYTMQECLEALIMKSHASNIEWEVEASRVRPTELHNFVGDFSKFEKQTGWRPQINFDQTMESVLEYWREKVKADLVRK